MMVRIIAPEEGMSIYDPCSGLGGMLVVSKEFLDERGLNAKNLGLAGQESNGGVWAISYLLPRPYLTPSRWRAPMVAGVVGNLA